MKKSLIPLLVAGFVVACGGDSLTDTDVPVPKLGVAGNSGCYTVSGAIDQVGTPSGLTGTISGDVVGDIESLPGPIVRHGAALFHPGGQQIWNITGGIVEPLINRTLRLEVDFVGILAHLPLEPFNMKARVIEGAEKANLTYRGVNDVFAFPEFTSHSEYHGVICP